MIVIAIMSVTVIWGRGNDCAKLAGWQALYDLASITANYLKVLAVQIAVEKLRAALNLICGKRR